MKLFFQKRSIAVLLSVLLFSLQCINQKDNNSNLWSGITETNEYYEVTGLGASSSGVLKSNISSEEPNISEAEAKLYAERIAFFQAVELLTEVLQGVAVKGDMELRDLYINNGEISQIIQVNIKNLQQLNTAYEKQSDGSWLAAKTVRFEKRNIGSFLEDIKQNEQIFNQISQYESDFEKRYTGVIIDLRYVFGYSNIITPRIFSSNGDELFSIREIDPGILF
ncbi:hypothetical protein ACFL7D_11765, partial [candidate division KSB1 bacterium]